jgi:hypothetical protein
LRKTSKALRVTVLLFGLLVASTLIAADIQVSVSTQTPDLGNPGPAYTYTSSPTNFSFSSGVRADFPADAYDGSNATKAFWAYGTGTEYGSSDGYFELCAYGPTAGSPRGAIITQVDLHAVFEATLPGFIGAKLIMTYVVDPSPTVTTLEEIVLPDGPYERIWNDQSEPNDGTWTWEDLSNLGFRFEREDPYSEFAYMDIYEVWATVHYEEVPQIHVNPKLQDTQPLTITLNATSVEELYGFEFKLYYNARVLTATSVDLGPFLNTTVGTANTWGYEVEINDTLGLVWATQTIRGDLEGGRITTGSWGKLATIYFSKDADGNSNFDLESKLVGFNPVAVSFSYGEAVKRTYPINHTVVQPVHDVAVTNAIASPAGVNQGENVTVTATVVNEGDYKETFDVTLHVQDTTRVFTVYTETKSVTDLAIGASQPVVLRWNTTGTTGNYTFDVVAEPLGPPPESDTADNTFEYAGTIWTGPDVEVSNVKADPTRVFAGASVEVNATVTNKGPNPVTFDLTPYAEKGWRNLEEADLSDNVWTSSSADGSDARWTTFRFNTTGWASVSTVEVGLERWIDTGTDRLVVALSNDNASSWSATTYNHDVSDTTDTLVWIDVTTAYSWTPEMITGVGVKLKYEELGGASGIIRVDYLAVRVTPLPSGTPVVKVPTAWKTLTDASYAIATPQTVTNLASDDSRTLTFNWVTTGYAPASYAILANTSVIPLEIETANNAFTTPREREVIIGYDVAVTSVVPNATVVDLGTTVSVDVTVKNEGPPGSVTFDVNAYAGSTLIGTQTVTGLASGATQIKTFNWGASGYGSYIIKANTTIFVGEPRAFDNTRIDDVVYVGPDVAVTSVVPSPKVIDEGTSVTVAVTVANEGASTAPSFNVNAYANQTSTGTVYSIGTQLVTGLALGVPQTKNINWDTTGRANDTYVIFANATILTGETDTEDNTLYADGVVYIGPDVAVTSVALNATAAYTGDTISIDVTVKNQGASPVTFGVNAYATPQWTNPEKVKDSDDSHAAAVADGVSTMWKNYPFDITGWTGVNKVEVGIERKTGSGGNEQIGIAVSNDAGASWSATTYTDTVTETTDTMVWVDVTTAYAWSPTMVSRIAVRLTYQAVADPTIIGIDYLAVRVTPLPSMTPEVEEGGRRDWVPGGVTIHFLGTQPVSGLAAGSSQLKTFNWVTTANATYAIFANATIPTGETDTADNTLYADDTVYIGPDVTASGISYISKVTVYQGELITLRVKVANEGVKTETFEVALYANTTLIDTWTVTDLAAGLGKSHTFAWNTASFLRGDYELRAESNRLTGETDIADNTARTMVRVKLLGDIDDNGIVDVYDTYAMGKAYDSQEAYRSTPRSDNWDPDADLNGNNFITADDLMALVNNFGKTE